MSEILIADFIIVLMMFLRILAMMITAPVFSHEAIPTVTRVLVAFIIAYITFLTIDKSRIIVDVNMVSLILGGIKEILTGLTMGFALNFIFDGISFAGHMIGYDMGLMMSEVMDPSQGASNNVVGEVIYYASTILFIIINGHHHLISAVVASFKIVPLEKYTINQPVVMLIIKYAFAVFTIALKIAAPIMVSFLLIHIAESIISKVIPQIQIFFITQPLKIGLGLVFLATLTPLFIFVIKSFLVSYEDQLSAIINNMRI
jgi:flagellar biosynthesis protein FliR